MLTVSLTMELSEFAKSTSSQFGYGSKLLWYSFLRWMSWTSIPGEHVQEQNQGKHCLICRLESLVQFRSWAHLCASMPMQGALCLRIDIEDLTLHHQLCDGVYRQTQARGIH